MDVSSVGKIGQLKRACSRLWSWYKALNANQRSYLNGAICLTISLLLRPFTVDGSGAFQFFAAGFWVAAMVADLVAIYRAVFGTIVGKLLLLAGVTVATTVAFAFAAQTVNQFVGINPGQFTHTITFTAVLIAVPLVAIGFYLTLLFGAAFLALYVMFYLLPDDDARLLLFPWYKGGEQPKYKAATAFVQVASFLVVSTIAFQWSQDYSKTYSDFIQEKGKWFLYTFETFERAPCQLEKGQKVAFVDGGDVLVVTKAGDDFTFTVRECKGG
ncbi:hypothetical protein [Pseudomonas sp. SCB32]|uniref:hypothetical protein n=1 Tax=Pseudomonas sp. SCB32 TaxID=2653853 RepID=UPI001265AB2B|nr:hypothetical protein [Pseudomonas sp. SCB32]